VEIPLYIVLHMSGAVGSITAVTTCAQYVPLVTLLQMCECFGSPTQWQELAEV
jgi:hypothetical protein